MSDFAMCYYDYCTKPELCLRSPKSGTRAGEHQSWAIFQKTPVTKKGDTETCEYFMPMQGCEDYA